MPTFMAKKRWVKTQQSERLQGRVLQMALRPVDGAFAPRAPRGPRRGPSDSHLDAWVGGDPTNETSGFHSLIFQDALVSY